jgi:NAD(P)-dependent dehydrogenase (short-subunit alcohol dehydrogenase family)
LFDRLKRPPQGNVKKRSAAPGVHAVAPGPIWTPLQVSGGAPMEKLEKFGSQTPLGRAGQPAELGSIYVQLAAADASFATGQVYGSAGGSGQP